MEKWPAAQFVRFDQFGSLCFAIQNAKVQKQQGACNFQTDSWVILDLFSAFPGLGI